MAQSQHVLTCLVILSACLSCWAAQEVGDSETVQAGNEEKEREFVKVGEKEDEHKENQEELKDIGGKEGEEGKEEEEEGEKEEEEPHFTRRDVHDSAMLIGAVLLVGCLYYLTNWPDDDIRLYTMRILSSTMAIFSAVLMYQGFNQLVELFIEDLNPWIKCVIQFFHCLLYLFAMQFVIAIYSGIIFDYEQVNLDRHSWTIADGLRADYSRELTDEEVKAVRSPDATRSVWVDPNDNEIPVAKLKVHLVKRNRQMRCWATLLSHMSGFAAINAGGWMQQTYIFSWHPLLTFIPVIITQFVLMCMFELAILFRQSRYKALQGDQHNFRRAKLCRTYCLEAEDDVCDLASSFLMVQVARFAMSGVLPNVEGLEEPEKSHGILSILLLYGFGFLGAGISIVFALNKEGEEENEEEELKEMPKPPSRGQRYGGMLCGAFAMVFAWSLLFGTRWVFVMVREKSMSTVAGRILLALALSIFSGLVVFGLDYIDDTLRAKGKALVATTAIEIIITSLAILVGFSWESCFEVGVTAVSSRVEYQRICKFVLGTIVFIFLVPAWRTHILPKEMALEAMQRDRRKSLSAQHSPRDVKKADSEKGHSPSCNVPG